MDPPTATSATQTPRRREVVEVGGGVRERESERVVEGEGGARSAGRRSRLEIGHRAV